SANIGTGRHLSASVGAAKMEKNGPCWTWPMKTKTSKRQSQIPPLVERGFAIHQQLSVLNDEFKKIKERLKDEASAHPAEHIPLLEKDTEGTQWIALGNGCECRIVFPEAKIKPDFDPGESDFLTIR